MATHEETVRAQAELHEVISVDASALRTPEEYVLHLIHLKAYHVASRLAGSKDVIDVGCNVGYGTEVLSHVARSIAGVDVSARALAAARSQFPELMFHEVDGYTLPMASDSADLVTSFQVVEHVADYEPYFSEIRRVLRPDGVAVLTTPNSLLRLDPGMKPWNRTHVHEFTAKELLDLGARQFTSARVIGLFATEPIYSIERNRLARARALARTPLFKVYSRVESVVPHSWVRAIRPLKNMFSRSRSRSTLDAGFRERHTIGELHYGGDDLDKALDLMMICSSDATALERAVTSAIG